MRKFISVFLTFLLFFYCFQISAFSVCSEDLVVYTEETIYSDRYVSIARELEETVDTYYNDLYQYDFTINSYIYSAYSVLTETEKMIYNKFVSALKNGDLSVQIDFNPFMSGDDYSKIDWQQILESVGLDHPEFFYISALGRATARYEDDSVAYIILTAKAVRLNNDGTQTILYTEGEIPICANKLSNAISEIKLDFSNRYIFIKTLHDYLCNSIVYVDNKTRCHDAYGALVEGVAVCQGYAEAFKLICDYYKIPCVCLTGTGNGGAHMWNAVQMDDGYWYLLDITWDDQENYGVLDDFFLVGLNTKDKNFGGNPFDVSHNSDGSPYLPKLSFSEEKYAETDHNTAFKATYNSITNEGNYLIRSFFDVEDSCVYYNGMYVDTNGMSTNGKFVVPSGENATNETWSLVLLGDSTGDGECNNMDFSDAVNKILSGKGVLTASDMAADMDCDGYLDVIDLSILQNVTNGLGTNIEVE